MSLLAYVILKAWDFSQCDTNGKDEGYIPQHCSDECVEPLVHKLLTAPRKLTADSTDMARMVHCSLAGSAIGYLSTAFYLGSRLSQIFKNWQRGSAEVGILCTMWSSFDLLQWRQSQAMTCLRTDAVLTQRTCPGLPSRAVSTCQTTHRSLTKGLIRALVMRRDWQFLCLCSP